MNIPQKDCARVGQNPPLASDFGSAIREPLVIQERMLWECIGQHGFEDQDTTFFSMTTCFAAIANIQDGRPAEPLIRRVTAMSSLSLDRRYQTVISPIIEAVSSRDPNGLRAAQRTALCAVLMIAIDQNIWPRDWDGPHYQSHEVWKPGDGS